MAHAEQLDGDNVACFDGAGTRKSPRVQHEESTCRTSRRGSSLGGACHTIAFFMRRVVLRHGVSEYIFYFRRCFILDLEKWVGLKYDFFQLVRLPPVVYLHVPIQLHTLVTFTYSPASAILLQ